VPHFLYCMYWNFKFYSDWLTWLLSPGQNGAIVAVTMSLSILVGNELDIRQPVKMTLIKKKNKKKIKKKLLCNMHSALRHRWATVTYGCANTVQSENGRPRVFLFELAIALSVVCRASSSSQRACIRKKMISQAFAPVVLTVESVILFVLAFYLLYRYGDIKRQNVFVTVLTLCIWFLSFFIVFLLPIDVSSVSTSCSRPVLSRLPLVSYLLVRPAASM